MTRSERVLLEEIHDSLDQIREYTDETSERNFRDDQLLQDAVLYRILVIGEAVKGLSDDLRQQHSAIEWTAIAGMRDILVHEYFRVDLGLAWEVVQDDLPELRRQLLRILEEEE